MHPATHIKQKIYSYEYLKTFTLRDKGFDIGFRLDGVGAGASNSSIVD